MIRIASHLTRNISELGGIYSENNSDSDCNENDIDANHLIRAILPNVGHTTVEKDAQQPDENNKDKTSSVQHPSVTRKEGFYQKSNDKLDEPSHISTCVTRDKYEKMKITLKMNLNGSSSDFLKLICEAGHSNAHDWVKKHQLIKLGESKVIVHRQYENKKKNMKILRMC